MGRTVAARMAVAMAVSVASASTSAWRIVWSRVRINVESSAVRIASVNSSRADWSRVIASSLLS